MKTSMPLSDQQSLSSLREHPPKAMRKPFFTTTVRWALVFFAIMWLILFFSHRALYYIQPGSDIVVQEKYRLATGSDLFRTSVQQPTVKVVVVGNSRVLAGFIPSLFDQQIGSHCRSWNMGVPGIEEFSSLIAAVAEKSRPTHLLLVDPPVVEKSDTAWQAITDDNRNLQRFFPFRRVPRDLFNFLRLSGRQGGAHAYWDKNRGLISEVLEERGYFFIASQSLFPGDRLPDDFRLPRDDPDLVQVREYSALTEPAQALRRLAIRYGITVLLIPPALREYSLAPSSSDPARIPPTYPIVVCGPDYIMYPNRYFSDFVHMNREGAERYTRELAALLRGRLVPVEAAEK